MTVRALLLAIALVACGRPPAPSERARLATLGRVWGFVKFHHPALAAPGLDWDQALLDAIPKVRDDPAALHATLAALIAKPGAVLDAGPGAMLPPVPAVAWLAHDAGLDAAMAHDLEVMRRAARAATSVQVTTEGAGNARFPGEHADPDEPYPAVELRLLALFRYWNAINYFFAYRELIEGGWDHVLEEFIPRVIAARDAGAYHELIAELAIRTGDGHAFVKSHVLDARVARGAVIELQQLDDQTVVRRADERGDVHVGDEVIAIEGVPVATARGHALRFATGSNPPARDRVASWRLVRSPGADLELVLQRADGRHVVRVPTYAKPPPEHAEPSWRRLGDVGVIEMKTLTKEQIAPALAALADTRGLIFDMRAYPAFVVFELLSRLHASASPFAEIAMPDIRQPGAWSRRTKVEAGGGGDDVYRGKVVVLVDESTMSRAEYFTMALQSVPGATVVGSQTAGADGNVSSIVLPGGITAYFSGLAVCYPDGRPTQRTGVAVDVVVRPTPSGLRAGRDEVLERALAVARGSK